MAVNAALLNIGANAMATSAPYLSLHSATPNSSGSNETSAARVAASWPSASAGVLTVSNKSFTGGAASGAVTHVGFWSASSAGTFYGYVPLTGDATFNASGEYTVTSVTLTGSAS